jgi:hypothetical protein
MNITEYRYAVYGRTATGEVFVVANDGGSGPMATGTDEWCIYGSRPHLITLREAEAIKADPKIGYAGNRCGIVEVYIYELQLTQR